MDTILNFEEKTLAAQKELVGKKMQAPVDAYRFLEKLPLEQMAYLLAESNNSGALSKIRAYLHKWRPIRVGLPQVGDRKSTRLNSSHSQISYAVFCLKKKKKNSVCTQSKNLVA